MKRANLPFLKEWLKGKGRKPLVVRGARQVGKTWIIRELAKVSGYTLLELNFEKHPQSASLFQSNEPSQILPQIEAFLGKRIEPEKVILFLDEIQAAPEILAKLRWFAEELPELPVIAAGSLLDFVLKEHSFSMPVGRIQYMHLEPLSFEEFLLAKSETELWNYLQKVTLSDTISEAVHSKLFSLFCEYTIIGGMPAAVQSWREENSLLKVNQVHHNLIATFRDDFAKYQGKMEQKRLEEVLTAVPKMVGQKFIYQRVNPSVSSSSIKIAVELLEKARVCTKVIFTSANGIPLGAETKDKYFKALFLDVGLSNAVLSLNLNEIQQTTDLNLVHRGSISKQVVGQLLRTIFPAYIEPTNYYWRKESSSSNAEIDYLIQHKSSLIPIEVKSGASGALRSLHLFMDAKKLRFAVRFNSELPSQMEVEVKNHKGDKISYQLLSLPFYLLGQINRLIETALCRI